MYAFVANIRGSTDRLVQGRKSQVWPLQLCVDTHPRSSSAATARLREVLPPPVNRVRFGRGRVWLERSWGLRGSGPRLLELAAMSGSLARPLRELDLQWIRRSVDRLDGRIPPPSARKQHVLVHTTKATGGHYDDGAAHRRPDLPKSAAAQGDTRSEDRCNRSLPALLAPWEKDDVVADECAWRSARTCPTEASALVLPQPFRAAEVVVGFWPTTSHHPTQDVSPCFILGEVRENVEIGGGLLAVGDLADPTAH